MMEPSRPLRIVPPAPAPAAPEASGSLDLATAYRRYAAYVAAIGIRLLGRDDEVDDLVQEVFLEAVRGLSRLRDADAIKGWFATVTVRAARRRLRLRRLRAFVGIDGAPSYDAVAAPEADPAQRLLLTRVYAVLDRLPVDQRIAWALRYVEGEQLDAVAAHCGCSLATAKRWIAAAQQHIEKEVRP